MANSRDWREWVRFAEGDYRAALKLSDEFAEQTSYLCQQSGEKYLKAIILFTGFIPVQTHDCLELLAFIDAELATNDRVVLAARLLNAVMTPSRYPDSWGAPTLDQARRVLDAAGVIRHFAREKMGLGDES
jgi:HEPN domain-containing protein